MTSSRCVSSFDDFVKSPHDKCNYRLITLPNSLQACLVSEPGLEKASAALDVHIGFFSDPKTVPGLAHFLEHLLFMGTSKYPKENEYSQYLSENSGSSNAFTCEEHTNYFFDVSPDSLYGALDRFAQFFISPLFDPSGTEREMNAVDSENKKNLNNDHWRLNQLEKHISDHNHPYSKFGTGNLETLNVEGIRDILIQFHEKFYSANLMKLVIYGRESLEELENWAVELFSSVKNSNVSIPTWPSDPWDLKNEKNRNILIEAKTLKEMRSMSITWLIPDQRSNYLTKPDQYLTHLIGHEGKGSLFQALKSRGWLTSLSAGCDSDAHGFNFFQISIDLSPQGWESYEEVLKLIIRYVSLLRFWGPNEEIFEECREINEINFKFREKGDPSTFTHQLATWMQKYQNDPRLILAGTFITETYNPDCIRDLINNLICDNMRITMSSSHELTGLKFYEPWYGTEFKISKLSDKLLKELQEFESFLNLCVLEEFHFPEKNKFIPRTFKVPISTAWSESVKEAKLLRSGKLNLWYKLDDTFEQPKSQISLFFRTPLLSVTPLHAQLGLLYKDLLKHSLMLYNATLAGLNYEFYVLSEGFELRIMGFSDKLSTLLKECLGSMKEIKFKKIDLKVILDKQLRSLQNFPYEAPYWHASYHLNNLLTDRINSIESRIKVLKDLCEVDERELDKVLKLFNEENYFLKEIGQIGKIDMLIHGSIEEDEAISLCNLVEEEILSHEITPSIFMDWKQRTIKYSSGSEIYYLPPSSTGLDNQNCSIETFFPITTLENVKLRTLSALFVQIFNEPFFDTLRTSEQLGYLVTLGLREKGGILVGIRFLIQSHFDPIHLDSRIENFLNVHVPNILSKFTETDLKTHSSALKQDLTQKKKSLFGESKQLWDSILSGSNDFKRPWIDAETLDQITLNDLNSFYENYLKSNGQFRSKISVHIWSKYAITEDKMSLYYNLPCVIKDNRDEFVNTMELYPCIYKPKNH